MLIFSICKGEKIVERRSFSTYILMCWKSTDNVLKISNWAA